MKLRALAFVLLSATAADAQRAETLKDNGIFTLLRDGVAVGAESFRIAQIRGTSIMHSTGTLIVGDQRTFSDLYTDTLGTPTAAYANTQAYALTITQGKNRLYHLEARARPGRLSSLSTDAHNEQRLQETLLRPGSTIILDPDFVHQLYFAAIGRRTGPLMVIAPHAARVTTDTVEAHGLEVVQIGGHPVSATRYTIGSGANTRMFWVDPLGRLLRVEVASQSLVAVRDDAP